ncbi:TadE/TadG family type IV pilus assembly protein [Pseudooctadecabacter sp.]|uniref:TadE/TadG family type IV pilus assembly protein n=1 Tax=Pseudooctadecabacter sp. TaxID=1966338 RepID=UPI0025E958C7|nr:hypothetical protein [Pseudooctadecabacter sp.]
MMFNRLKARLRQFRRDEDGTIIAEAVTMFPSLFACVIAMIVFFDAFRNQSVAVKANYTIADAVSREDGFITNIYINSVWRIHRFLTDSPNLTRFRISVVQFDATENEHTVVWARGKGGLDSHNRKPLVNIGLESSQIPVMVDNEFLIVVQTEVDYTPAYSIGLGAFTFENVSFTRPRWAPNLCFSPDDTADRAICPRNST